MASGGLGSFRQSERTFVRQFFNARFSGISRIAPNGKGIFEKTSRTFETFILQKNHSGRGLFRKTLFGILPIFILLNFMLRYVPDCYF